MTEAEALIQDYGGPFREQALELAQNIVTLQKKIDESRPAVENEPLYLIEIIGDRNPRESKRENKAWISFRAQVKAHHDALLKLNALIGSAYTVSEESDPLDDLLKEMRDGASARQ